MENATKALLIAASILIVIVLIALGVRVLNSGTGTVQSGQRTMDSASIAQYNSQFGIYNVGDTISKSKMNNLIQKVIAANAANAGTGRTAVTINGATPQAYLSSPAFSGHSSFTISSYQYDANNEYIVRINVTAS